MVLGSTEVVSAMMMVVVVGVVGVVVCVVVSVVVSVVLVLVVVLIIGLAVEDKVVLTLDVAVVVAVITCGRSQPPPTAKRYPHVRAQLLNIYFANTAAEESQSAIVSRHSADERRSSQ